MEEAAVQVPTTTSRHPVIRLPPHRPEIITPTKIDPTPKISHQRKKPATSTARMANQRMAILPVVKKKDTEDDPDLPLNTNPRQQQQRHLDLDLRRPTTVTTVEDDVAVGNDTAVVMTATTTTTVVRIGSVEAVGVDTVAANEEIAIETTMIIPEVVAGIIITIIASVDAAVAAAGRGVVIGGAVASVNDREVLPVTVLVGTRINGNAIGTGCLDYY